MKTEKIFNETTKGVIRALVTLGVVFCVAIIKTVLEPDLTLLDAIFISVSLIACSVPFHSFYKIHTKINQP